MLKSPFLWYNRGIFKSFGMSQSNLSPAVLAGILIEQDQQRAQTAREELDKLRTQQQSHLEKELLIKELEGRGVIRDQSDEYLMRGIMEQDVPLVGGVANKTKLGSMGDVLAELYSEV